VYRVLRWINIALALLTLLAFLAPRVSPEGLWPSAFLALLLPWLLLTHFLLVLLWMLLRRNELFYSLVVLVLGFPFIRKLVTFFPSNAEHIGKVELVATSFNTHGMLKRKDKGHDWVIMETQWKPFPALHLADLLCLQEFTRNPKRRAAYLEWLKTETGMPYQLQGPGHGLVICSAYPLRKVAFRDFGNANNGYLVADLALNGRTVRLINAHLQSNDVSSLADNVAEEGNLQERETWLQLKGMAGRYRQSVQLRARQADEIRQVIEESPHPVLLCGDLNDLPTSYVYQKLGRGRKDSFCEAGIGMGVTYRGKIPGLRIDYLLPPAGWEVSMHQTVDTPFSDHRAVSAVLLLP